MPGFPEKYSCQIRSRPTGTPNVNERRGFDLGAILSVGLLVAAVLGPRTVRADAIVVDRAMDVTTIAEIFVRPDSVRVELEIGMDDLDSFRNLAPDPVYERLGHAPEPFADRLERFPKEDWVMLADGRPLFGVVETIQLRRRTERDEITGEPVPLADGSAEVVLFAVVLYPLPSRPRELTVRPPGLNGQRPQANIGFVLYHFGLPVNDFQYLDSEETVTLDWSDPFYSCFANRNLRQRYDAPMSVFLYVDHFEVRKEVIVRPVDLQRWIDLGIAGRDTIPVSIQDTLKARIAEFLAVRGPVTVDGRSVKPALDRIHFVRRMLRRTGVVDPPEPLAVNEATLSVIFVAPVDSLPEQVSVAWDLFDGWIQYVPAVATDETGGLPYRLAPGDSVLLWQNSLTDSSRPALAVVDVPMSRTFGIPVLSVLCLVFLVLVAVTRRPALRRRTVAVVLVFATVALVPVARVEVPKPFGNELPSVEDTTRIVEALLTNVYRAFDYRGEERICDTLARSASDDLLTRIYLETRRALEIQSQGGARVKVKEVIVDSALPEALDGRNGFRAKCSWSVAGSVGHWGHIHIRGNRYDAVITVEPMDGTWKITDIEVHQEQRQS